MLPGDTPEDDRCIFSGVLVEGLWGTKSAAFSKREPNKITSQSLAKYLRTEVPKVADRYQFTLNPSALPTFSDGDDTPLTPPAFALTQRMANKAALATRVLALKAARRCVAMPRTILLCGSLHMPRGRAATPDIPKIWRR